MKKIFNPFQNYSEKQLVLFGSIITIIATALTVLLNGRFDGVLDLHFVEKTTIAKVVYDLIIDLLILTILLFIIGKLVNKKTRLIDILATSIIAKIPFYFLLFFNINDKMFLVTEKLMSMVSKNNPINIETSEMILLVFSGIATFTCLIWSIILLFNGFKTATNSKETKHVLLFIVTIIIAEVLSKILILKLNY
jgi:hypothetical protein